MHSGPLSGIDDSRMEDDDTNFDIFARIEDGWYNSKKPYPKKVLKPRLPLKHTAQEAANYAQQLKWYEKKDKKYREEVLLYQEDLNEKHLRFKKDAIAYCGLKGHQKAEAAINMAFERDHDCGLAAVVNELNELADLIL